MPWYFAERNNGSADILMDIIKKYLASAVVYFVDSIILRLSNDSKSGIGRVVAQTIIIPPKIKKAVIKIEMVILKIFQEKDFFRMSRFNLKNTTITNFCQ